MIKNLIYQASLNQLSNRIRTIEERLAALAESKLQETKSSVGDKYETGRAMIQIEEEKAQTQLISTQQQLAALKQVDIERSYVQGCMGSLVHTNYGSYFIAAGIGRITIDQDIIYVISPESPIGQLLLHKKEKDVFLFQDRSYTILQIS